MKHSTPFARPTSADVERSLVLLGRTARREAAPPVAVAPRVMAALARRRTTAVAAAAWPADDSSPLGWLAAAALAAAVAMALLALPALQSLGGPLVEVYGLLGGGAL